MGVLLAPVRNTRSAAAMMYPPLPEVTEGIIRIPGFTAEASLREAAAGYRVRAVSPHSGVFPAAFYLCYACGYINNQWVCVPHPCNGTVHGPRQT